MLRLSRACGGAQPLLRVALQRMSFASSGAGGAGGAGKPKPKRPAAEPPAPPSAAESAQTVPHIAAAVKAQAEARAMEPFVGYTRGLAQSVIDRGTGPIFRELPLQERLMQRLPHRCPLCSSHPITGILPQINELVETNVELLVKFVDTRGTIMQRRRTGVCAKHQRKLARTIKRARHLGFLSFTRGPDDLNNIGPPDFNDMWREHGDFYSPTHRESDLDQAINQSAAGADPRLDEFGQIRQPWQLPAPGARHEALPDAPAARLARPGQPVNAHDASYRPATFHLTHRILAAQQPSEAIKISIKGAVTLSVQNKAVDPEFARAGEDPIEKFGPGEHYVHEAEFFGRRAPAMTTGELKHDDIIKAALAKAKERKAQGVKAAPAQSEAESKNWAVRVLQERAKLEVALKIDRVMKEQHADKIDDIEFASIVTDVQRRIAAEATAATEPKRVRLQAEHEQTRYPQPDKPSQF